MLEVRDNHTPRLPCTLHSSGEKLLSLQIAYKSITTVTNLQQQKAQTKYKEQYDKSAASAQFGMWCILSPRAIFFTLVMEFTGL